MDDKLKESYFTIRLVKNAFLDKIKDADDAKLNKKPADGSWSLGQVYFHCYIAEYGTMRTIQKNIKEDKTTQNGTIADRWRNFLLLLLLKSPFKFKAPEVVQRVPEHITFKEIKDYFENTSVAFENLLQEFPEELTNKRIFRHPIGGLFTMEQTLNFIREHYRHHDMQIERLLNMN